MSQVKIKHTRCISVSQEQYDRYINKVNNSKLTPKMFYHTFEGDNFKTQIWVENNTLMAEDPTGIREIVVMKYDNGYIMNGVNIGEGVVNINSKKSIILDILLKQGIPTEKAIELAVALSK